MFEISWSEILVIGVVALIVVGPKDLPVLLRTVGKYMGAIKRQAAEFRAQFDEAMRESELDQIRKDMESIKTDAETTIRDATRSVQTHMADAKAEFDAATDSMKVEPVAASQAHAAGLEHLTSPEITGSEVNSPAINGPSINGHDVGTLPAPSTADAATPSAGSAAVAAAAAAAAPPPEPIKTGA